jgi:hypothetical protein
MLRRGQLASLVAAANQRGVWLGAVIHKSIQRDAHVSVMVMVTVASPLQEPLRERRSP